MTKLVITVTRQVDTINQMFDELIKESKLGTMFLKTARAVYLSKLKSLFYMMRKRLSGYITKENKNEFECVEEGDQEYIKQQLKKFEDFMFGDEKTLNEDKEYQMFKNDRFIDKVIKTFKRSKSAPKSFLIKKALRGGKVFDFFTRSGISIVWKVKP